MLNKIISFSLRNRPFILVAAVLLIIGGCWTAWRMEVDVFPDLNAPTVVVMTESRGMAAEEVERLVTFPIETSLSGSTGVRRVRSSSSAGFSVVWVEFDWGTDIYRDRQIVSEKLSTIAEALPPGTGSPTLGPQSSILGEVMFIGLTSDQVSQTDLRSMADRIIRPRILATGGVAQASVMGGDVKEYQILLHSDRMRHFGVSLAEVMAATGGMNRNATGGVVYEYGNEYIVRGLLSTTDVKAMSEAVVKRTPQGMPVTLADIADVKTGAKTPKTGLASISGKPGVLITVTKQPGTSTLELTQKLDNAVTALKQQLPQSVKINTELYRQQSFIDASISNIQKSLIEGGIFVVLVLFIFLMNGRTTLISLVTIPLSLLVTILVMKLMGLTINTMSIGGMAIAIGSLVDDAIVDVENVFKRLRHNLALPPSERRSVISVVHDASCEVRMPILNSTLIIIVSFIPLFFLSGLEGRMLVPLGVAFIVSLLASTLVALTLTPVLCSYLLGRGGKVNAEPRFVSKMKESYAKLLEWVLQHTGKVVVATAVLFVITLGCFFTLGRSFLPPFNEGSFTINVSTVPGVSFEESDKIGRQAEQLLLSVPEVKAVARKTGRAELDEHALGVNTSEMEVPFELKDRTKDEVADDIRHKLSHLPGVVIEIGQPISHRIDAMLSGTRANIAVKIFGDDLGKLLDLGNQIKQASANVEGITDLNVEQLTERPQLTITPRRQVLASLGITLPEFAEAVSTSLGGTAVSQVTEGNAAYDLVVKVADDERSSIQAISNLLVDAADGKKVPLGDIADISSTTGPGTINRENSQRKLVVSANVSGRDLRSAVEEIQQKVRDNVQMPEGYHVEYGGQFESEQAASRTLSMMSVISIAVILLLLFMQFRSWRQSVIVLLNLPLALAGGVGALMLTSGVVSIPAVIGFISLFGIATRGGMLLVDRYNELHKEGISNKACIMQGSTDRLLPIIMTALTSGLALIPLAVGADLPGNEIQSPMAQVILGGLLTSTLLNLVVVPAVYARYCSGKAKGTSGIVTANPDIEKE